MDMHNGRLLPTLPEQGTLILPESAQNAYLPLSPPDFDSPLPSTRSAAQ